MSQERASRVEELFAAAVPKGSAAERAAYLDGACGQDHALRERVESLLASHDAADSFMSRPPVTEHEPSLGLPARPLAEGAGTKIGRYKLLQLIGEGGFGSVFMAQQDHPVRRTVALKIIKLGMDSKQVVARFEAERQALALMDHPNIARVLDAGATDTGRPYFVMELVRGVPITTYCDTNNLSARERLELFVPICHAVQHAHQKGIIHRDIKPSNILVTMADGKPIPKVIDFGIAKATSHRLTEQTLFTEYRQLIGTPEYMSPEQAEMSGIDVDTRTDVYSLGVLLYELLTGTTPFDGKVLRSKAYGEIQRMIREVEPPRPSTRISSLGPTAMTVAAHRRTEPRKLGQLMRGELDWVVMKAMEKDRTRRYETANGLAADVRRYLDDEPVAARPASTSYRLQKFVKKHKAGAAAVAAVAAALLLGIAGTTVMMFQARAAQRDTEVARKDADDQKNKALGLLKDVERAKAAAEKEARRANASSAFLRRILASPGGGGSGGSASGRQVKVADVLDQASRELDDLNDQPDLLADARYTLGQTYMVLGLFEEARREMERSWTLARQAIGPQSEQALRAAAEMIWIDMTAPGGDGRAAEREPLARETLAAARSNFGDLHPVTHQAANALAGVLSTRAEHAAAEAVLRPLAERALREPPERRPSGASRTLANLASAVRAQGRSDESNRLQAEAVAQAAREPELDPVRRLRIARSMADGYLEDDKLEQAAEAYRKLVEEQGRILGENHPDIAATKLRLLTALERLDRFQPALDLRRKMNAVPQIWTPGGLAASTFAAGELALWLGQDAAAREAFDDSLRQLRQGGSEMWRAYRALAEAKLGLRSDAAWSAEGLRVSATMAVRDGVGNRVSPGVTGEGLDWSAATYTLAPWLPPPAQSAAAKAAAAASRPASGRSAVAAGAGVASAAVDESGTLAQLRARPEPAPGIYLVALSIPRRDKPPLRVSRWGLWSPWELSLYEAPETERYKLGEPTQQPPGNGGGGTATRTAPSFSFFANTVTSRGCGPAHRRRFKVVGMTRLSVPSGTYTLHVHSDGLSRAWVDGKLLMDQLKGQGDEVNLEIAAGAEPPSLKVECSDVNEVAVVNLVPKGDLALAVERKVDGALSGVDAQIDVLEQSVAAPDAAADTWWDYAHHLARRGEFEKAVAPMRKALELAPNEHGHWYTLGLLLAYGGNDQAYRDYCRKLLDMRSQDKRQQIREYLAAVCAVRPDSGIDAQTLAPLMAGADLDGAPWAKLRKGMVEYRAGNFEQTITLVAAAGQDFGQRDGGICAQLFRAMAEHRLGHEQEAADAYSLARLGYDALPAVGATDLNEGVGLPEWLVAHVVMREAAEVLKGLDVKASDERVATLTRRLKGRQDAGLLASRARAYAIAGRFKECAADMARSIEIDHKDPWAVYQYASVLAYLGEEAAFRKAVADGLTWFGDAPDPATNSRIAKAAALLPVEPADLPKLRAMADKAMAAEAQEGSTLGWYRLTKALVEYRAGNHEAAAELAAQARASNIGTAGFVAADALQALALHGLGRTDEAVKAYRSADRMLREKLTPAEGSLPITDKGVQDWCIAQVLVREARPLFDPPAATQGVAPSAR